MKRTLFLSVLVAGAALALAAGSVLADKGGPEHGTEHGVATGLQEEGGGDGVEAQDNGDDSEGAGHIAEVIATSFDADEGAVLTLHEAGFGFGAIFKLYLLAAAGDETALAILASGEKGDGGFAFGKLFKELTDEVSVLTDGEDGLPTNLGKAVSGSNKDATEATGAGTDDGDEDDGDGPPEHAPAHGRNKD
ncbi:MAG: hypothetical protein IH822_12435 [Chloroflexi bacterium]|nr:hypothetical protein [Chloroflexota bacterium]